MNINYNNANQSVYFFRELEGRIFDRAEKQLKVNKEIDTPTALVIGFAMGGLLVAERVSHLAETTFKAFYHLFQGNYNKSNALFLKTIENVIGALISPAAFFADIIAYTILFKQNPEFAVSLKDEIIDDDLFFNSLGVQLLIKTIDEIGQKMRKFSPIDL